MKKTLMLISLLFAVTAWADTGVTMVFMSDPQYPWYSPMNCGEECIKANSSAAIRRMTSAIDNVTQLGQWPSTLQFGAGAPVAQPQGVIINGDLTAYFHQWQYLTYVSLIHLRGTFPFLKPAPVTV
ncbi:MAG: hypothetical protein ACLGH0_05325, partial [Thermoanaerobaculia bacterium]